jgi:hypothetical protein
LVNFQSLEIPSYRTHPENLLVSEMINKIKGFERREIKKAVISDSLSSLAPLSGWVSKCKEQGARSK